MDFEDAEVREVRPSSSQEGEQLVRLKKERRWLLPALALLAVAALLVLLFLPGEEDPSRVSLPAARTELLKETLPLGKSDVLRILSNEGFVATPGNPQNRLDVAVSVRREGIILRTKSDRLLILWSEWPGNK